MRIINYQSIPSFAGQTKTARTFGAWLGEKPANLQSAVLIKPHYTANMLLDAIGSVYQKPATQNEYEDIKAMSFQWQVSTERLTKVYFSESCTDSGTSKRTVHVILDRKYYDKGDTFRLKNGQLLFVQMRPEHLGERRWRHSCTLVTNNLDTAIDTRFMAKGQETMYISNYFPELSERGYSKWTFNAEKHKNYISRHRHSDSESGDYATMQNVYAQVGSKAAGNAEILRMPNTDKRLFEQFLWTRAANLLWSVSNYDENGKCLDQEKDGRDIPMGDGIITQFSRYCDKFQYHDGEILIEDLDDILYAVCDKTGKSTGNTIPFIMNRRAWRSIQRCLTKEAKTWGDNGGAQFVRPDGKGLKFGNYFSSYTVNNNTVTFMVDDSMTEMYPDRGFAIALDGGMNEAGRPNIRLVTLEGRSMLSGTLLGMGGTTGTERQVTLATSVDGTEYHVMGYGGVAVHNPYAAVMLVEAMSF
jgi:hypothetical protein